MENASKALLIAGGVLIAILIVSVLVVTLNIVNSNQKTREKALATEQLAEFNQKYEAYNKKALRGTDIITLMKMAIENNNKMEVADVGEQYFINIRLELKNTYTWTKTRINKATGEETPEGIDGRKSISGTISLGEWKKNNSLSMDKYVGNLFGESIVIKEENQTETIYTYSPLANLKKAVFKCKEIKYNDNGRIKELVFEER